MLQRLEIEPPIVGSEIIGIIVLRGSTIEIGSARGNCEEFRSHLPRGIRSVGGRLAKAQERTRLPSRVHSRASSVVSLPWERSF